MLPKPLQESHYQGCYWGTGLGNKCEPGHFILGFLRQSQLKNERHFLCIKKAIENGSNYPSRLTSPASRTEEKKFSWTPNRYSRTSLLRTPKKQTNYCFKMKQRTAQWNYSTKCNRKDLYAICSYWSLQEVSYVPLYTLRKSLFSIQRLSFISPYIAHQPD